MPLIAGQKTKIFMEGGCRKVMARMNFFGTNIHGLIDISELNVMNMRNGLMVVHVIL